MFSREIIFFTVRAAHNLPIYLLNYTPDELNNVQDNLIITAKIRNNYYHYYSLLNYPDIFTKMHKR